VSEKQQLAALLAVLLLIGCIAIGVTTYLPAISGGDLVVEQYSAAYSTNGTLVEEYTYHVGTAGKYRMLYRTFDDSLTTARSDSAHIQFVGMTGPAGVTGYVKDASGTVTLYDPDSGAALTSAAGSGTIASLAEKNEVGIFNPQYFPAGTYTVRYVYSVVPPVEYDASAVHVNLKLARLHIPYRNVAITIPSDQIQHLYAYPPGLRESRTGSTITLTGSAGKDETVAVELLLNRDALSTVAGVPSMVEDVSGKAVSGSFWYGLPYTLSFVLKVAGSAAVLMMPLLLLLIYRRFGGRRSSPSPNI